MMERLSRIGFHRAHKKYRDIEMFHELCDYQDTELSPADIIALKSENERLWKQLERAIEEIHAVGQRDCDVCLYYAKLRINEFPCKRCYEKEEFKWRGEESK